MNILLTPCILTLGSFVVDKIFKTKRNFLFYTLIFLALLASNKLFSLETNKYEINLHIGSKCGLTPEQRNWYHELAVNHTLCGHEFLKEAEDLSSLIPHIDRRKAAKTTIALIIANIAFANGKAKAIIAVLALVNEFAQAYYDQWMDIREALDRARYHFSMADFYQDMLILDTLDK